MNGYRQVEHTADTIVEAWGQDLAECMEQAVVGLVATFADLAAAPVTDTFVVGLSGRTRDELLLELLDEVLYQLDVAGRVPVRAKVGFDADGMALASLDMTRVDAVEQIGSPPKAISRHGLTIAPGDNGWTCRFLVDV